MPIWIGYTVACDECGNWATEVDSQKRAISDALSYGFIRKRHPDGGAYVWLCPGDRTDLCGEKITYSTGVQDWCLLAPGHAGQHDWGKHAS